MCSPARSFRRPATLKLLAGQVEGLTFKFLDGDINLAETGPKDKKPLNVQPDGIFECEIAYCMLEAKRIKRGAFHPEQLAREFLAVLQEAKNRSGLLLLVLPVPPPVGFRESSNELKVSPHPSTNSAPRSIRSSLTPHGNASTRKSKPLAQSSPLRIHQSRAASAGLPRRSSARSSGMGMIEPHFSQPASLKARLCCRARKAGARRWHPQRSSWR